jgi:ribosomal-protein-alanine N-acetyltransferase
MATLIRTLRAEPPATVAGERVYLRPPVFGDWAAWSSLRGESHGFLAPWEPTWPADDLTRPAFRRRLRRYARDARDDLGYAFLVFLRDSGDLCGGITVSGVRRGVTQSASMGYWMGERFAGRGLMTDAVRALLPWLFDNLRLHRVEAACLPTNGPSKALLRNVGFREEGYAREYLKIDGRWADHVLFGMLASDPRP